MPWDHSCRRSKTQDEQHRVSTAPPFILAGDPRSLRLPIAALAFAIIAATPAAPLVLRAGGSRATPSTRTLLYHGRRYVARQPSPVGCQNSCPRAECAD